MSILAGKCVSVDNAPTKVCSRKLYKAVEVLCDSVRTASRYLGRKLETFATFERYPRMLADIELDMVWLDFHAVFGLELLFD